MAHLKISTKGKERARRPTNKGITDLCDYLDKHLSLPMRDIIHFAIEAAMRVDEITRLRWVDLNEADKTIVIRDRKHPRQKQGNDQGVPLLGKTYAIIQRQPKPATITFDSRIFPVQVRTITTIFPRAKNALHIKDLHFHDLRHEGVSRLFEQGYQIHEVALVSGHRDWGCWRGTHNSGQRIYTGRPRSDRSARPKDGHSSHRQLRHKVSKKAAAS